MSLMTADFSPFNTSSSELLTYALEHQFGEFHVKIDPQTGMKAIIAIHNTKRGPALGGCRFIHYDNDHAAFYDAMRLAQGMSYKSAIAHLPLGGGKAVIIKPRAPFNRQAYMHEFGRFLHTLNGQYITALDSGTCLDDMDIIAEHTPYVASLASQAGDPAPTTARCTFRGIQAAVLFKLDRHDLKDLHIALQGLGQVGYILARMLHDHGARLTVADTDQALVERAVHEFGAFAVDPADIHKIPCDVFVPCALGEIINDKSLPEMQTSIIAGAANNQLAHPLLGQKLHDQGILYAPDYVINAGGIIFAASKYLHTPADLIDQQIEGVYNTLLQIFYDSVRSKQSTHIIADKMAEERLA